MIKLPVNPEAVATLVGFLNGAPEQLEFLQGIVQTHGANPGDYYVNNPDPQQSYAALQATPAFQAQDWARLAHPHVIAQVLIDVCEKSNQPLPDNLHVAVDGQWQPLNQVQPTYRPVAQPAPTPAPAPAPSNDPYPQPVSVASTPPAPTSLQLAPEPEMVIDAEFSDHGQAMVSRDVLGAQVVMEAQTAQTIDAARQMNMSQPQPHGFNTPGPSPSPQQALPQAVAQAVDQFAPALAAQQVAMAAQPAPEPVATPTIAGAGQFGLPQPFMTASKGASVFDKDPKGETPKGVSPRQVRDIYALMPHLFAAPAGDVVGKGTGSVQRHRLYTAALLMIHTALSSVPDKNASVGYLLWHLEHLRYNAAQTPGGNTMLTFEQWLYKDGGE